MSVIKIKEKAKKGDRFIFSNTNKSVPFFPNQIHNQQVHDPARLHIPADYRNHNFPH